MTSIVVKVKYEETLRRFTVAIKDDWHLEHNMEGFRAKIRSLFNLSPDVDFRLTYVDEDDDVVALVDDNDLLDVVKQDLDPLRITAILNRDKSSQSDVASSERLIPERAFAQSSHTNISKNVAEAIKSVEKIDPNVSEILKSVQEPLGHALSKLSLKMSSKAASASPVLADLFDGLSKIGQSYTNTSQPLYGSTNMSGQNEAGNYSENSCRNKKPAVSADEGSTHAKPANGGHATTGRFRRPGGPFYLSEKGSNSGFIRSPLTSADNDGKKNKDIIEDTAEKKAPDTGFNRYPEPRLSRPFDNWPAGECPFSGVTIPPPHDHRVANKTFSKASCVSPIFHKGVQCDGCGILPITGPRFKSRVKYDYDLCSICFLRMGNDIDYTRFDIPVSNRHPFSFKDFHGPVSQRIPTNIAGMLRPVGKHTRSRLDSRFIMDVNVMDGTTMPPSTPFTKIWRMRNNGTLQWQRGLRVICIGGDRFSPSDSVEIEIPGDGLNVGSELDIAVDFISPELPGRYISYWRMAEPSGHKFGQRIWVLVQVDASADLTRESSPILNLNLPPECNETSHPQINDVNAQPPLGVEAGIPNVDSNHKFKTEMEDPNFPINDDLLVLTHPAGSPSVSMASSTSVPVSSDVSTMQSLGLYSDVDAGAHTALALYPRIVGRPASSAEQNCPHQAGAVNSLYLDVDANANNMPETSAPPGYPVIAEESFAASSNDTNGKSKADDHDPPPMSEKTGIEEKLLKELEQMGFKQVDLNKEVARMNQYDLERCVDDLCDVSEWDPILEELQEMGFHDKETNKKLLAKNNGSLTRVVMDLIAGEKD